MEKLLYNITEKRICRKHRKILHDEHTKKGQDENAEMNEEIWEDRGIVRSTFRSNLNIAFHGRATAVYR